MCCVGTEAVCVGVGLPRQSAWYTQQGVESAEESSLPQCCLFLHLVLCACSGRAPHTTYFTQHTGYYVYTSYVPCIFLGVLRLYLILKSISFKCKNDVYDPHVVVTQAYISTTNLCSTFQREDTYLTSRFQMKCNRFYVMKVNIEFF